MTHATTPTHRSHLLESPLDISPSLFESAATEFTLLSRESRDHEFAFPVVLVPVVQERPYVAQYALNVIPGRRWSGANHLNRGVRVKYRNEEITPIIDAPHVKADEEFEG